jgi:hypothetical protein
MDERLQALLTSTGPRLPADIATLCDIAATHGVELPDDYIEFMTRSDGGEGDLASTWIQMWSVDRINQTIDGGANPYEGVLLFAGDGANTVYGFDAANDSEIIEGDWIGLSRDDLIRHGKSLSSFLADLFDELQ